MSRVLSKLLALCCSTNRWNSKIKLGKRIDSELKLVSLVK